MKALKIGDLLAKVPIVQGGMGVGISLSGLASAVANAGGVGVISAAGLGVIYKELASTFDEACILGLKEELRKARIEARTSKTRATRLETSLKVVKARAAALEAGIRGLAAEMGCKLVKATRPRRKKA